MYSLRFRELLPQAVQDELDSFIAVLKTKFFLEHETTGDHGEITVDRISTKALEGAPGVGSIPLTGNLRFDRGGILLDTLGNSTHIAGLRPAQLTANVDDYNPPGLNFAFMVEVDSDANRDITGLKRVTRQKRLVIFGNRGNFDITLKHNDSNSNSIHRFFFPGGADVTLTSGEYLWLYYDVGSEIWRPVSLGA